MARRRKQVVSVTLAQYEAFEQEFQGGATIRQANEKVGLSEEQGIVAALSIAGDERFPKEKIIVDSGTVH